MVREREQESEEEVPGSLKHPALESPNIVRTPSLPWEGHQAIHERSACITKTSPSGCTSNRSDISA